MSMGMIKRVLAWLSSPELAHLNTAGDYAKRETSTISMLTQTLDYLNNETIELSAKLAVRRQRSSSSFITGGEYKPL